MPEPSNDGHLPRVRLGFHKSSQKGGEWGCDVEVQEGAVHLGRILTDADDLMDLAATLRARAQKILEAPSLIDKLEASLVSGGVTQEQEGKKSEHS